MILKLLHLNMQKLGLVEALARLRSEVRPRSESDDARTPAQLRNLDRTNYVNRKKQATETPAERIARLKNKAYVQYCNFTESPLRTSLFKFYLCET